MSSHKRYNKRGPDFHHRHARIADPDGPQGDLPVRHLLPRFSPTAIWPSAAATTSSNPVQVPVPATTPSATPTTTPSAVVQPATTASSTTPVTTSTSSSTTSSSATPTTTNTPTSTSTSAPTISSSTPSTLSTSSITSIAPVLLPTTSIPSTFTESDSIPTTSSIATSATPSSAPATTGGTSTSVVVGGIAAGLVGLAGLIFAFMFFMRRWRQRGEEEKEFNADTFKRQSAILVDDEQSPRAGGSDGRSGFNPRPPTMIERHVANRTQFGGDPPPMPSLQQYNNLGAGAAGVGASRYGDEYDYPGSRQPSFSPGQVMPTSPPPNSAGAQFFMSNGQAPAPYSSAYNEQGQLVRHPSHVAARFDQYGQPITRPPSTAQGDLGRQNSVGGNAHYVDLDRSSVTPFQAAQYAEISRKLNEPPVALNAVDENEEEQPDSRASDRAMYANQAGVEQSLLSAHADGGNANAQSPFVDPQSPAEVYPNPSVRALDAREAIPPPSPIYSLHSPKTSHERALSNAPSLPEIKVPERTFSPTSYDFPQTPSARPTPSPFHTNFSIPTQQPSRERPSNDLAPDAAESAPAHPVAPVQQAAVPDLAKKEMTPNPGSQRQRPTSTYTVYDESDAYGGF